MRCGSRILLAISGRGGVAKSSQRIRRDPNHLASGCETQYPYGNGDRRCVFAGYVEAASTRFLVVCQCRASRYLRFGAVIVVIVGALSYLAYTGVRDSKSYYVTIKELNGMGSDAYSKRLRVAGNVAPGSIKRQGTHLEFQLVEEGRMIPVVYAGSEAPPDTFKDNAQALAEGKYGHDGVFHATNIQAKCASKYAPKQPGQAGAAPAMGENPQKAELTTKPGAQGQ